MEEPGRPYSPWCCKESDMTELLHFHFQDLFKIVLLCILAPLNLFYFCYILPVSVFYYAIHAWNVPLIAPILLKKSLVFPILLLSSISFHCSLKKPFLSLLAILWTSSFRWVCLFFSPLPFACLLSSAICKASSNNHFAFLHFLFFQIVLVTVFYTMLQTSIHSFSGTLSTRSNPLNLFITSTV